MPAKVELAEVTIVYVVVAVVVPVPPVDVPVEVAARKISITYVECVMPSSAVTRVVIVVVPFESDIGEEVAPEAMTKPFTVIVELAASAVGMRVIVSVVLPTESVYANVLDEKTGESDPADTMIEPRAESVEEATDAITFTLNEDVAILFPASVAEHKTPVFPSGNTEPEAGTHVTTSVPSTTSVAVGFVYETTTPELDVAYPIISPGVPTITGGTKSEFV